MSEDYELVTPNVTLIAKSTPVPGVIQAIYGSKEGGAHRHRHFDTHTPAPTMELAGRVCYAAYGAKSAKTDSHEGYLQNILNQKHHCYSSDTEVLTSEGWKSWEKVSMDDSFATLSESGQIEYQYPSEIIREEYQGDMIGAKAKGVDLLVTPNHRMLACITTTKAGRRKEDFSLIPADQLIGISHAYKKDGEWEASGSGVGEVFAWLAGFFAGDGRIEGKWDNQVVFHMSKARKISALTKAVQDLEWEMSVRYEKQRADTGYFSVFLPEDKVDFFRSFYDEDGQKVIPQEFIMSLNKKESLALLQGMIDSDGSVTNESGTGRVFDSTSKSLRDAFSQVALHAGFAASEVEGSTQLAGREVEINGVKTTLTRDCKRVSLSERQLRPEIGKKDNGTSKSSYGREEYSGTVYCATVPNHTLYVRRNGKPVWSGNSVLEHSSYTFLLSGISRADSHEIVRHRHFSFSQTSQRYVLAKTPYEISVHPTIYKAHAGDGHQDFAEEIVRGFDKTQEEYNNLKEAGLSHKEASEAARQYLPNAAAVEIVVTGNVRSWIEFISKRDHPAADASLQDIAHQVYEILSKELPEVFSYEARQIWDEQFAQKGPKSNA